MPDTDTYATSGSELVSAGEAVRLLPISRSTLLRAERAGYIIPLRTPGGHRRYRRADVEALIAERTGAAAG